MEGYIQLSLFGRTSPEHSAATREKTFVQSWKNWPKSKNPAYQSLDLRTESGQKQGLSAEMDGKPVYCPDDGIWGIISVDSTGRWAGIPFFRGRTRDVNIEYDIKSRGMSVYAYPPAHIDREEWTSEWEWFDEDIGNPLDGIERDWDWGWRCSKCGYILPDNFDNPDSPPKMKYCVACGRAMTPEARDELEKRLRG